MRTCLTYCILLAMVACLASGCVPYRKDYTGREASICEVHHRKMEKTVAPVYYGLAPVRARDAAMAKASTEAFPHADDSINPSCVVQRTREGVIYTCPDCVRARRAWQAHYDAKH